MKLKSSKINIVLDGQFGSCGKGLLCSYIGNKCHIDIVVTSAGPNSGHTFYVDNKKIILKMLPVSAFFQKQSIIYFCAGAIIDIPCLLSEIERHNIDPNRIKIHPRAAIVEEIDRYIEKDNTSSVTKIASTQSGTGSALSRKIMRSSKLAQGSKRLSSFIKKINLHTYMEDGCTVLMEISQGYGLSLSSGYSYPYCTSREITVSGALSDAGVHPHFLGNVILVLRTFPIRVGNIISEDGTEIGNSGPFYPDSEELSWSEINQIPEYTTITGRVRRVATFSYIQYKEAIEMLRPNFVFLNFANYLTTNELSTMLTKLPEITHIGMGSSTIDVITL